MTMKGTAWLVMTALAFAVSGYAIAMLVAPPLRPTVAQALFIETPATTAWHFAAGAIALIAGAFQVNSRLRARFLDLHRWLGRLYVAAVLVGGVAALALAQRSFGGPVTHVGFGMLAILWIATTVNAYRHIRAGNVPAHREWMWRSYALTLAAVTLRIYLPVSQVAGVPFEPAYQAISWLCWVPNLLAVEWLVRRNKKGAEAPLSSVVA
jgi:uncharacterized membrane protein